MDSETPRKPSAIATAFFTVFGNFCLVVATIFFGILCTIAGFIPPRGRWMFLGAQMWSHVLMSTSGVRIRTHRRVDLQRDKGYIYMANHESMFDIPAVLTTLPGETRLLAKRSLFKIPIFGWSLYAGGFIPVDRGDRAGAKRTFDNAIRVLESGRSILLFPEETRTHDGNLLPFKPGGFLMALKTGFPIVPVGIRGSRAVRPRNTYTNHPGPVEVHYGEPIPVEELSVRDRKALMAQVRSQILELRGTPEDKVGESA